MRNTQNDLNGITEGVIWKQLLLFFFPILLGTFFQQLYNTVDAVIVGNFVGKQALAAVGGATGTFINLLVGFFVGLSSGATVIISQFYGAQKARETSLAVHTSIALALAGGVVLMVVGLLTAPLALRMMDTPTDIMDYALTYMRVYFCGTIFSLLYNIGSGILRAVGDSKRPLYFLIICSLTNLLLDLLFVVSFRMGVFGVALATLLSQAVSAALVVVTLMRTDKMYKLVVKKIRLHLSILKDIIVIGLPSGLQSVMYSVSNIIIQSSINGFGTDIIAAWTAYGKIDGIFWMIMGAFGVTVTTFVGQNFGARKFGRMRKAIRSCMLMALGTSVVMSVLLLLWGGYVYRLFTSDAQVIQQGIHILNALVPYYFTYVAVEVLSGAVRGTGDSLLPMLITCVGICVLRVVWIWGVVPLRPNITMVVLSYPVTWAITSVLFILYYLKGNWFKRRCAKAGFSLEESAAR